MNPEIKRRDNCTMYHRRRQGGANDPLWKKIFEIYREIPLTRIFFLN
jgi:hypothetical protein